MQNGYTQETLLQYFYQELNKAESNKIESALQTNIILREEYNNMIKMLHKLDEIWEKPHPTSVDLVLEYSASRENLEII